MRVYAHINCLVSSAGKLIGWLGNMLYCAANIEFESLIRFQAFGIIGKAVEEAIQNWIKEKEENEIAQRQLELLKKGFKTGKLKKFNREELYDRKY